jgi:N-acetylglutamate synthase-like GNAT family acetyltransferase
MEIRPARVDDAEQLSGLMVELGYVVTAELIRQQLICFAESADDAVLVAVADDKVIGCISLHVLPMFHLAKKLGRITAFVITNAARNSGVGAQLLASAHVWFEAAGCTKFELTSADHRIDAHRFYERHGYSRDGLRLARKAVI